MFHKRLKIITHFGNCPCRDIDIYINIVNIWRNITDNLTFSFDNYS